MGSSRKSRLREPAADKRVMGLPLVITTLLVLLPLIPSWAQSRFVAELRTFSTRYHEDPSRLDTVRDGLEQAVKINPHVEDLVTLAQVYFIRGEVRATSDEQKLAAYNRGRQAANQARNLDRSNPEAHFWYAANTARWGDLDKAEAMFRKGLELDPQFTVMRVGLAKTLIKKGQIAEARRELEAVLNEKEPRNLADWTLKDSKDAHILLQSIQRRS